MPEQHSPLHTLRFRDSASIVNQLLASVRYCRALPTTRLRQGPAHASLSEVTVRCIEPAPVSPLPSRRRQTRECSGFLG